MNTSSAVPDDLRTYARRGAELAGRLDDVARRVHIAIEAFRSSRPDLGGDVPHMEVEIQAVAQGNGELDHWVGQVGEAFVKADSSGASRSATSLVIADDQAIRRNIKRGPGPRSRFSSRADATKAGTREAAKVRGLLDGHHPKKLAAELGKAESSLADPDFAAGFFKGLGPKGTFDLLTAARGKGLSVVGRALALAQEHQKLPETFFEGIVDAAKRQAAALYAYEHGGGAIDIRDRQNYALHKYENGSTAPPGAYDFLDTIAPVMPYLEAGAKVAVIGGAVAIVSLGAACVAATDGACAAPVGAAGEQAVVVFGDHADEISGVLSADPSAASPLFGAENSTIVPEKIYDYALNPAHASGGDKARVFESVLGFTRANADMLIDQVRAGVMTNPAHLGVVDEFGMRFTVDMPIVGPNGATAIVRTAWIYDPGSDYPRLVTLFVR